MRNLYLVRQSSQTNCLRSPWCLKLQGEIKPLLSAACLKKKMALTPKQVWIICSTSTCGPWPFDCCCLSVLGSPLVQCSRLGAHPQSPLWLEMIKMPKGQKHSTKGRAGQRRRTSHSCAVPPHNYPNSPVQISGFQTCLHMGMTCRVKILLMPMAHPQKWWFNWSGTWPAIRTL